MARVRSASSKVSPHGKGLMEEKGEQGEHNWSLSGGGGRGQLGRSRMSCVMTYQLTDAIKEKKKSFNITIIECKQSTSWVNIKSGASWKENMMEMF